MKARNIVRPSFSFSNTDKAEVDPAEQAAARAKSKAEAAYDAALVQRFIGGEEAAFTEIVHRHYPRIRALAYQTLHNEGDAEEVAQDTFIRAHRGLGKFRGDCSLASWLYCIGLNLARNRYWFHFRRHRQDTFSLDKEVIDGSDVSLGGALAVDEDGPPARSMASEFVAMVAEGMERLTASHREILMMRTKLDLSYEEIASNLGIDVGTVKSRVARARENLRSLLRQMAPELGHESNMADFFEATRGAMPARAS